PTALTTCTVRTTAPYCWTWISESVRVLRARLHESKAWLALPLMLDFLDEHRQRPDPVASFSVERHVEHHELFGFRMAGETHDGIVLPLVVPVTAQRDQLHKYSSATSPKRAPACTTSLPYI